MNFLAHFHLAAGEPGLVVGAVLGEFVRGRNLEPHVPAVQRGIRLHRRVDAFSDLHPAFGTSRQRLAPRQGRYAGLLVDLYYDHLLAVTWPSEAALAGFAAETHRILLDHMEWFTPPALGLVRRLVEAEWLCSYRREAGMQAALARLARRVTRENRLASAWPDLQAEHSGLASDFARFWPELEAHGAAWRAATAGETDPAQ